MKQKKMEMDFVVEGNDQSMHILNAVSPASPFPCHFPSMCVSGSRPGLGRLEARLLKILVNKSEFIAVQKSI